MTLSSSHRVFDVKIVLCNNRIDGLTKGQYSPTSETGKKTQSTPFGSVEQPFNPLSVAIGAKCLVGWRSPSRALSWRDSSEGLPP